MTDLSSVDDVILGPFDQETQKLLCLVDGACQAQAKLIRDEVARKKLAGEDLAPDAETVGWLQLIKAYGILFNRAVEASWIKSIYKTKIDD